MLAGIVTATLLFLFVAGWVWVWLPSRRREFETAARTPLDEDDAGVNS
jgi:cytochrome c oxidase cbb3-type subunit 4